VFDLYQVQLTYEERYNDGGCEAIRDEGLIPPEDYQDGEGPTKHTKLRLSCQMEESLGKLRVEEGERHDAEDEGAREVQIEAQRCAIYSARERNAITVIKQYLKMRAQEKCR